MVVNYESNIETLVKRDKLDVVLFMNNSSGDWSMPKASILAKHFPKAKTADKNSPKTKLSMLGRYTDPVPEPNRNAFLLNIHVRKTERSMISDDEVANLKKAMGYFSKVLYGRSILIVPGSNTNLKKLESFVRKEMLGNRVTIAASKPQKSLG